ncbi:unnamed protein product [Lampetra fluviatilis]
MSSPVIASSDPDGGLGGHADESPRAGEPPPRLRLLTDGQNRGGEQDAPQSPIWVLRPGRLRVPRTAADDDDNDDDDGGGDDNDDDNDDDNNDNNDDNNDDDNDDDGGGDNGGGGSWSESPSGSPLPTVRPDPGVLSLNLESLSEPDGVRRAGEAAGVDGGGFVSTPASADRSICGPCDDTTPTRDGCGQDFSSAPTSPCRELSPTMPIKQGWLRYCHTHDGKLQQPSRRLAPVYVEVSAGLLVLHGGAPPAGRARRRQRRPRRISLAACACDVVSSEQRGVHVLGLSTHDGRDFLFHAEGQADALAWGLAVHEARAQALGQSSDRSPPEADAGDVFPRASSLSRRSSWSRSSFGKGLWQYVVSGGFGRKSRTSPTKGVQTFGVPLEDCPPSRSRCVPKVVEACCEALEVHGGLRAEGIYRVPGRTMSVNTLLEQIDLSGGVLDTEEKVWQCPSIVGSLLKGFFSKLPEPLMTYESYEPFLEAMGLEDLDERLERIKELVENLPRYNYHTLRYIIRHLRRVADNCAENKMNAENLGIVFGPTFLRSPAGDMTKQLMDLGKHNTIIETLIKHCHWIFIDGDTTPKGSADGESDQPSPGPRKRTAASSSPTEESDLDYQSCDSSSTLSRPESKAGDMDLAQGRRSLCSRKDASAESPDAERRLLDCADDSGDDEGSLSSSLDGRRSSRLLWSAASDVRLNTAAGSQLGRAGPKRRWTPLLSPDGPRLLSPTGKPYSLSSPPSPERRHKPAASPRTHRWSGVRRSSLRDAKERGSAKAAASSPKVSRSTEFISGPRIVPPAPRRASLRADGGGTAGRPERPPEGSSCRISIFVERCSDSEQGSDDAAFLAPDARSRSDGSEAERPAVVGAVDGPPGVGPARGAPSSARGEAGDPRRADPPGEARRSTSGRVARRDSLWVTVSRRRSVPRSSSCSDILAQLRADRVDGRKSPMFDLPKYLNKLLGRAKNL